MLVTVRLGNPRLDELEHLVALLDVVARDVGHHPVDVVVALSDQGLQRLVRQDNCIESTRLCGPREFRSIFHLTRENCVPGTNVKPRPTKTRGLENVEI